MIELFREMKVSYEPTESATLLFDQLCPVGLFKVDKNAGKIRRKYIFKSWLSV